MTRRSLLSLLLVGPLARFLPKPRLPIRSFVQMARESEARVEDRYLRPWARQMARGHDEEFVEVFFTSGGKGYVCHLPKRLVEDKTRG